jgi:MFS family permease
MADRSELAGDLPPVSLLGGNSRVRYKVLAFAVALAAVTYLDRVCIAQTAPAMRSELGLSKQQMAFVFSAFTLAYALFEIPTGMWGDRIGTRRVLARIVVWWSSFTIATAAAVGYRSLLAIRFLFGAGEAGAFPNVSKTFSRWFPVAERGRAQGIFFMGAHLGGGLTPLFVASLLEVMHWRAVFILFGSIGFFWALAWYLWFRDEPAQHPAVSAEEWKHIQSGRLPEAGHHLTTSILIRILSSKSLLALCLMYFTQAYGFYFNITWLPTYLHERAIGYSMTTLGILAGLPLILSSLADLLGGFTTDRLTQMYGLRVGRCGLGALALVIAGLSIIDAASVDDPLASALFLALAGAAASFLLGSCWSVCLDIAGPHAGLVTACMNTSGQIGAVLSPVILPLFKDWATPLYLSGALYLLGACCWWFVEPQKPIVLADGPVALPSFEPN